MFCRVDQALKTTRGEKGQKTMLGEKKILIEWPAMNSGRRQLEK
jgi:hypothetical protein